MTPEVSIIIPYFKKELFLSQTINSILNQTFKNFEIIIIDDELSENSEKILKEIYNYDERIFIYKNLSPKGAGNARNFAFQFCKGDYYAFCDSDDLWENNKLEKQINFMKKIKKNFTYTNYFIIDEIGRKLSIRKVKENINYNDLIKSCDIGLSTVVIKNEIFKKDIFRFANLKTKEDYVLWLRLAKNGVELTGLNENLVYWRLTSNSLSSSTIQKLKDGYKVYRDFMNYGRYKSLVLLFNLSVNYLIKKFNDRNT